MKKKNLLLLVLCITCLFLLCACNASNEEADPVIAIELIADSSDVEIGSFSVSNYSLNVTYKSGKIDSVPLTNEMISDTELLKFYTYGSKEVSFNAFDLTCKYNFNVVQKQIKNAYLVDFVKNPVTQIYERVVEYTGNPFEVSVDGDIPAGATISFSNGSSSFTNVGNYEFKVYITCDSYQTKQLQGSFTINKAVYDMTSVHFKDVQGDTIHATYSGQPVELSLEGYIPEGVVPSFKIQSLKSSEYLNDWPTTAGNYLVSATFEADIVSHEKIKDITTYLVIDKKQVSLADISFDDQVIVYDGKAHTFTLTNEALLTDPSSSLSKLVTFEYESNVITNAGSYIAKANFSVLDSINYSVVDSLRANILVKKADYDLSNVVFDSESITYDKNNHGITLMYKTDKDGNMTSLPNGVVVSYSIDGKTVDYSKNEGVSNAGTHTVEASFTHSNSNYNVIPVMTALLRIEKCEISFDSLQFVWESSILPDSVAYNGESYSPELNSLPDGILAVKYEYIYAAMTDDGMEIKTATACKEARTYTLKANFTEIDPNYFCDSSFSKSFEIITLSITDSDLVFNYEGLNKVNDVVIFEYDGKEQFIELKDKPSYVTSVKYVITNSKTSALANGDMPGEYYQETQLTYFNGFETTTYTTARPIEFSIVFEISNADFSFISDPIYTYSGVEEHPDFNWNTSSDKYNLIKDKFATINYFYRPFNSTEEYTSVCPIDVGRYEVKAVFSDYLTGKNGDTIFENVVVTMEIQKRIFTVEDLMQLTIDNATTGESMSSPCVFRPTYTFKYFDKDEKDESKQIKQQTYADVYIQDFNYVYDGKKRVVTPIENIGNYGTVKSKCYYLVGNTTTDVYTSKGVYETVGKDQSKLNLTDSGLYVYEMSFEPNSNCEFTTNCKLFIQINIQMLSFDKKYFKAQDVYKNYQNPCEFDTTSIPFKLNGKVVKYVYKKGDSTVDLTKPLAFATAAENNSAFSEVDTSTGKTTYYYYVEYTISFENTNASIDAQSFTDAVTSVSDSSSGIESITYMGLESGYKNYKFRVKIKYID